MARKVKCAITHEYGTSDTFVKIKGRYYKSQEVYDAEQERKAKRRQLINYICTEFLGYGSGQPFPTSLPRKLQELSFYDDDVILETFKQNATNIHYQIEHKQFNSEYNKIAYIFAIVRNTIADVNSSILRKKKQERKSVSVELECTDLNDIGTIKKGKDISKFLDEDDL